MSRGRAGVQKPFSTFSTDEVPVGDRVDYWQDLFVSCRLARPAELSQSAFRGKLARYTSGNGSSFARIEGGPLHCHFGHYETGRKILGIVRKGTLQVRHDGDAVTTLDNSSGFVLIDADRGLSTMSTDYELAQLALPRGLVNDALDLRERGLVLLPNQGLAPLLRAQFEAMASCGETLDETDAATAMHVTTSLAMAFLSRAVSAARPATDRFDDVLFVAAHRYMEAHAALPNLTASGVAFAIGCSRAHLYRVFLERDRSVGGTLREIRLMRARIALVADLDCPIGTIAFECGYMDHSAFGKAFRRRFGQSPQDCRKLAQDGGQQDAAVVMRRKDQSPETRSLTLPDGRPLGC